MPIINAKIGIVEDEAIIAMSLANILEKCGYEVAFIAGTYEEAHDFLKTEILDLILVDVQLAGGKTGIDLANDLKDAQIPVVFLTANADPATVQAAKMANPAAYLVKPFNEESIYATIEVALHSKQETTADQIPQLTQFHQTLFIRQGASVYKVKYTDILYAESEDIYTHIYTNEKKYAVRMTLVAFQRQLNAAPFIRIHKSFVINASHLESLSGESVFVKGNKLPIGRAYKAEFLKQLPLL